MFCKWLVSQEFNRWIISTPIVGINEHIEIVPFQVGSTVNFRIHNIVHRVLSAL